MATIEPIDHDQQQHVIIRTADFFRRAGTVFNRPFQVIPVVFNLTGRAAGMYRVSKRQRQIRYNPYIFAKYFDDNLAVTVPHEVAHYITDIVYGLSNIRPHGAEWQAVMQAFGADASRTCSYDLEGVPVRTHKRYAYRCSCTTHQLTTRRHNNVRRGKARYYCRYCGEELALSTPGETHIKAGQFK
jgi:SprT protein